jgi:hypothetical protein
MSELGQGGMATVYLAEDCDSGEAAGQDEGPVA